MLPELSILQVVLSAEAAPAEVVSRGSGVFVAEGDAAAQPVTTLKALVQSVFSTAAGKDYDTQKVLT